MDTKYVPYIILIGGVILIAAIIFNFYHNQDMCCKDLNYRETGPGLKLCNYWGACAADCNEMNKEEINISIGGSWTDCIGESTKCCMSKDKKDEYEKASKAYYSQLINQTSE
jgi:hypothetical protein